MNDIPKPKTPGDFTLEQVEALRPLAKLVGLFSPKFRSQFRGVERHMETVKTMLANRDLFAKTYSPLGWVNYDRMSTDVVANALSLAIDEGEAALTAYHLEPDNLRFLGYRFYTHHYEPWSSLYERAVERAGADDYLSAIPLILSIIDGVCTTTTAKHPFSGGADAPVFDSQTSGPGGLSEGLALLGSTRRKLDNQPLAIPFRHGIVHGLNPNYGHPIVAAKAFNLLQATVDYFDRLRDEADRLAKAAEEQRPADWRELARSVTKNADDKKRLDLWTPRPLVSDTVIASAGEPHSLHLKTPEGAATVYLDALINRNFGALALATIDYPQRPIGYRAGRIREDMKEVTISDWKIVGVEDTAAAMSNVAVELSGSLNSATWTGVQRMRMMFSDDDNHPVVRGQTEGRWIVMPDFISGLWVAALRAKEAI